MAKNIVTTNTTTNVVTVNTPGPRGPVGPVGSTGPTGSGFPYSGSEAQITGSLVVSGSTPVSIQLGSPAIWSVNNPSGNMYLTGSLNISGSVKITSGSLIVQGGTGFSGSFSGSYSGDGSGLTGIVSASYATTASYAISASHEIIKEISSSHANTADTAAGLTGQPSIYVTNITASGNISASGTYYGDGSNLTGISAGFWTGSNGIITRDSDVQITGSLTVSGSGTFTNMGLLAQSGSERHLITWSTGSGGEDFRGETVRYDFTYYDDEEQVTKQIFNISASGGPTLLEGNAIIELGDPDQKVATDLSLEGIDEVYGRTGEAKGGVHITFSSSLLPSEDASFNLGEITGSEIISDWRWKGVYARTGSFGIITGDGSNLTGVVTSPFVGDLEITGSLRVSGSQIYKLGPYETEGGGNEQKHIVYGEQDGESFTIFVVSSSGFVGIGQPNPEYKLDVTDDEPGSETPVRFQQMADDASADEFLTRNGDSGVLYSTPQSGFQFPNGLVVSGSLTVTGSSTLTNIGKFENTGSDIHLIRQAILGDEAAVTIGDTFEIHQTHCFGLEPVPATGTILKISASAHPLLGTPTPIVQFSNADPAGLGIQDLDFDLGTNVQFHGPSSHTYGWVSSSLVPYTYFQETTMNLGSSDKPWDYIYANTGSISLQPTASIEKLIWHDMVSCYDNVFIVEEDTPMGLENLASPTIIVAGGVTASLPTLNTASGEYSDTLSRGARYWIVNGLKDGSAIRVQTYVPEEGAPDPADVWLFDPNSGEAIPTGSAYVDGTFEDGWGESKFGDYIKIECFISSSTNKNAAGDRFWNVVEKRGQWSFYEPE